MRHRAALVPSRGRDPDVPAARIGSSPRSRAVDLEIAQGDFVTIQGPTGGGKSTLLQLLGALDTPEQSGSVVLGDTDLATARRMPSSAELRAARSASSSRGST